MKIENLDFSKIPKESISLYLEIILLDLIDELVKEKGTNRNHFISVILKDYLTK